MVATTTSHYLASFLMGVMVAMAAGVSIVSGFF
jgi:hypothetical protein